MQPPIDEHYTCCLCCCWCRLRVTNTTRVVCVAPSAGSDLWTKYHFHALLADSKHVVSSRPVQKEQTQNHLPRLLRRIDAQMQYYCADNGTRQDANVVPVRRSSLRRVKLNTSRCPKTLTQLTLFRFDSHVVALKCSMESPQRSRLSAPCCFESHNLLAYLMIQPDVAAEAGVSRDEATCKHLSIRKLPKPYNLR